MRKLYILIPVIIIFLLFLSTQIQVSENNVPIMNSTKITTETICKNECNSLENMAFSKYEDRICYCWNIPFKKEEPIYKSE